jgi:hypothetical protein
VVSGVVVAVVVTVVAAVVTTGEADTVEVVALPVM